jgi:hypothetical protein
MNSSRKILTTQTVMNAMVRALRWLAKETTLSKMCGVVPEAYISGNRCCINKRCSEHDQLFRRWSDDHEAARAKCLQSSEQFEPSVRIVQATSKAMPPHDNRLC